MLVRRDAFEQADGFDTGFHNSLEDVDLCLRIGEAGGEVHYCHEAWSPTSSPPLGASRTVSGAASSCIGRAGATGSGATTSPIYAEDGLIDVEYAEAYPLRLGVSPHLAAIDVPAERPRSRACWRPTPARFPT